MRGSLLLCLVLWGSFTMAQNPERCGTDQLLQNILRSDPTAIQRLEQNWQQIEDYLHSPSARDNRNTIVTIPVVFHIIHSGQAVGTGFNIADTQVISQIAVLNECYRKRNADTSLIPGWFKSRTADIEIEFCLASTDPQGNPTNGITRDFYPNTANFDVAVKPFTQWDPTKYLNIWTTILSGNILGYATPPNMGPANQDGVVLDYRHVGCAPANPFHSSDTLGRTGVHEVGHWLGLYHTFQDSCAGMTPQDCNVAGDRICDTPPEAEATYGSSPSLTQNTCHESPVDEYDMWMNFMDYVDDKWLLMFTNGQKEVMRAVLNTSRLSIQSSLGCTNTATAFTYTGKVVDASTNQGVENAKVLFDGPQDFEVTTDANGNFTVSNLYEGNYDIYAGKWGYMENFYASHQFVHSGSAPVTIPIHGHHYYDDFIFNYNWSVSGSASSGFWTRDAPIGTFYQSAAANPSQDVPDDFGLKCFVTGNGGGAADADDVDNGSVTLISPVFDLSGYTDPYMRLYRWFFAGAFGGNPPDDVMTIKLNNGTSTVILETLTTSENQWTQKLIHVSDFIPPTATMRLIVEVSDLSSGNPNIVEAAIDKFEALEAITLGMQESPTFKNLSVFPNPSTGIVNIVWEAGDNEPHTITARNPLGEEILHVEGSANHAQLDFSRQAPGVYFISISNSHSEKVVKFLLTR